MDYLITNYINFYKQIINLKSMKNIFNNLFRSRKDYVEFIPFFNIEEGKKEVNIFFDKIKSNKGKINNFQLIDYTDTKSSHYERFEPGMKGHYNSGYVDDVHIYQEHSHYFMIYYSCLKEIKYNYNKTEISAESLSELGKFLDELPNDLDD